METYGSYVTKENRKKANLKLLYFRSGNVCESNNQPYVFDPCCFYGHSEYDLGIGEMFGGFRRAFRQNYENVIGKVAGSDQRIELYQLFHYLNHWNHFGGEYRSQSLNLMKKLNQIK